MDWTTLTGLAVVLYNGQPKITLLADHKDVIYGLHKNGVL